MLKEETKTIQHELVEYCRMNNDGDISGTRHDRLHNYRRLIYTIYWEALADAYPIAKSILAEKNWNTLVDDFISNNPCQEPQLFRMPFALIEFIEKNNYSERFNVPYLFDLLRFEWIEIEVHAMKDIPEVDLKKEIDDLTGYVAFNPYMRLIQLNYPIHKLKTDDINTLSGTYFLLVYRQENGTVQYLELNAFTASLVDQMCLNSEHMTFEEILNAMFTTIDQTILKSIFVEAKIFCSSLHEMGIILGIRV